MRIDFEDEQVDDVELKAFVALILQAGLNTLNENTKKLLDGDKMISENVKFKEGMEITPLKDVSRCPKCRAIPCLDTMSDVNPPLYRVVCRKCGLSYNDWFNTIPKAKRNWEQSVTYIYRMKRTCRELRAMGLTDEQLEKISGLTDKLIR